MKEMDEGFGSCALTTASTTVEVMVTLSEFSCSCLALFIIKSETFKAMVEEVVVLVVSLSFYLLIRRDYHRNVDRGYFCSLFLHFLSVVGEN
ncbi:hypothetical protein VNO80_27054 [Phaseolus coccineus]|uniref:Uncharacterized protein n=1 Tax=Phaseolus coccineus TaxID=3886 RepID=A0AAN9LFW2_PHACN